MDENMSDKIKIIIVDDSAISRGILEKAFKESGYFEILASLSNGRKAVDYCNEHQVDVVISDYDMPEMNGIESIRFLTGDLGIPVIIYFDDRKPSEQAISAGAAGFFVKPTFTSYSEKEIHHFINEIVSCVKRMENSIRLHAKNEVDVEELKTSNEFNYDAIIDEISLIKNYLKSQDENDENYILMGELSRLNQATIKKDDNKIIDILQKCGQQIIDISKRIGCSILATYITHKFGI